MNIHRLMIKRDVFSLWRFHIFNHIIPLWILKLRLFSPSISTMMVASTVSLKTPIDQQSCWEPYKCYFILLTTFIVGPMEEETEAQCGPVTCPKTQLTFGSIRIPIQIHVTLRNRTSKTKNEIDLFSSIS